MNYKLTKDSLTEKVISVLRSDTAIIPFDPANSDYQQFKKQINDDTAQLEDVDGNVMTPDEAKAYVATLP